MPSQKARRHENTMELYFRALLKNGESFEVRLCSQYLNWSRRRGFTRHMRCL